MKTSNWTCNISCQSHTNRVFSSVSNKCWTSFFILFISSSSVSENILLIFLSLNSFSWTYEREKPWGKRHHHPFYKRGKRMFYFWRKKKEFIMLKNELMIHFIYHKMCLHTVVVLGRSFSFKFLYPFMLSWLSQTSRSCVI